MVLLVLLAVTLIVVFIVALWVALCTYNKDYGRACAPGAWPVHKSNHNIRALKSREYEYKYEY